MENINTPKLKRKLRGSCIAALNFPPLKHHLLPPSFPSTPPLLSIPQSQSLLFAMKMLVKLSPKRLFGSKKSRSNVSRSDPSSFSSETSSSEDTSVHHRKNTGSGTPTSVLPETSRDWPDADFEILQDFKSKGRAEAVVSVQELEELLAQLGADPPSKEEVVAMLNEIGCDGDGSVSIEALMSRVESVCGPTCDAELKETFDFFDTDRDGRITAPELLKVFKAMGDERCTLDDCRRMIAVVDDNKNGFVCFEDFSRMMELQR